MTIVEILSNLLEFAKTGEDFWIRYTTGKRAIVHFGPNGQLYALTEKKTYESCLLVLGYINEVQRSQIQTINPPIVFPTTWFDRLLKRIMRKGD